MERKLATIQIISELRPIEGADKIEVALMEGLGWECVVKKDEFRVGDKVIYVEVDSVLPEKPEYEFLRERKFRVRAIKLRKQVSMGLILPLYPTLPEFVNNKKQIYDVGEDYSEYLGITKYLSPSEREELEQQERKLANDKNRLRKFMMRYSWFRRLFLYRKQKKGWPYWVTKTDEIRCQNLDYQQVLKDFGDKEVYVTEKIDYQSVTFTGKLVPRFNGWLGKLIPKKYQFVVCSRNMTTNDKNSLYWKIAKKYNIEQILRENPTLTIQGEQGDTKVQGNKYGLTEPTMWVFNVIDHEKNYHYDYFEMSNFCVNNGLNWVPLVWFKVQNIVDSNNIHWKNKKSFPKLSELGSTVQELVEFSKGKSVINPKVEREGIVVRCIENGKKLLSFKAINPQFLLKYD